MQKLYDPNNWSQCSNCGKWRLLTDLGCGLCSMCSEEVGDQDDAEELEPHPICLVEDMAQLMREVNRTSKPCAQCGELIAFAYAEIYEAQSSELYRVYPLQRGYDAAVVCKLCSACANAHDEWKARGRPQAERGAGGLYTKGWLVQVTLRGHMFR